MDQQQYHSQTQCSPGIPLYDEPGDTWLVLIAGLLLGVDQIPFSNCEDALRSSITAPECHLYTPGKCLELGQPTQTPSVAGRSQARCTTQKGWQ